MQKSEFGAHLQSLMEERGVTAKDLAKKCGVRYEKIRAYIIGDQWPTRETIGRLAHGLGVDETELLWSDRPVNTHTPAGYYDQALTTQDWSQSTIAEIAQALGASDGTIRGRIYKLKQRGITVTYKSAKQRHIDELAEQARKPRPEAQAITHDEFGKTLYRLMDEQHVSTGELCDRARISTSTLYEYLYSVAWPTAETIRDLADALGVDAAELTWTDRPIYRRGSRGRYDGMLMARDWSDYTAPEIAQALGAKESTIRSALARLQSRGIVVPYRQMPGGHRHSAGTEPEAEETDRHVPREQCRQCGYRITDCGDDLRDACQYILITGRMRPMPEHGRCPVRVESAEPFHLADQATLESGARGRESAMESRRRRE